MRQIVTLRLENNNLINVIADVAKPQDARKIAVDNSARLLGNNSIIMITNQSKIVSSEKWEQSRVSNSQTGNKLYRVAFFLNNVTQCVDINAVSVKSAYNNIKIKFGIEENLFMIIYDMTQSIKKKSAMEQSLGNYRNGAYISKLLKDTANKTKTTEELELAVPTIALLLNMVKDNYTGKYRIAENDLISTIACLIYFNEPYATTQDIISNKEDISDISMMLTLISIMEKQIYSYKKEKESRK